MDVIWSTSIQKPCNNSNLSLWHSKLLRRDMGWKTGNMTSDIIAEATAKLLFTFAFWKTLFLCCCRPNAIFNHDFVSLKKKDFTVIARRASQFYQLKKRRSITYHQFQAQIFQTPPANERELFQEASSISPRFVTLERFTPPLQKVHAEFMVTKVGKGGNNNRIKIFDTSMGNC